VATSNAARRHAPAPSRRRAAIGILVATVLVSAAPAAQAGDPRPTVTNETVASGTPVTDATETATRTAPASTTSDTTPTTATTTSTTSWQLVQSEDFSGSAVNTTRWRIYGPWIPGHAGNGIRDGRAVTVANGLLTITARMIDGTLVSGGISNRLNQTYGKFEFRARTDGDPSLATSGVILTWPGSGNWPVDGENDIYETTLEPDRTPLKSFIHYGSTNQQYWFHHAGVDGRVWHTFAMEWTPTSIKIFRDGTLAWTVTNTAAIPDVAHHLSIQLDAFKKSMSGTVRLQVDWVKIYKRVTTPTVDTTPPTTSMAAPSLLSRVALNAGRPTLRLNWSASDNASGVHHVEVAQSTDGGAYTLLGTQGSPWRRNRVVAAGHTYRFRVRAVDAAGNVGAWSYGSPRSIHARSQANVAVRYGGAWSTSTSSMWWGGSARSSSRAGSTAKFTFTGKGVSWVAARGAGRGKANVYVNGVLRATVDLYASTTLKQRVVWSANYTTTATRTVTIKVLGTSGRPRVDVDGFFFSR
jgi:beta-glucanase (GH16 family)